MGKEWEWAPAIKTIKLIDGASVDVPEQAHFCASNKSEVFHSVECGHVEKIDAYEFIYYLTREEAIAAGKRPCTLCEP